MQESRPHCPPVIRCASHASLTAAATCRQLSGHTTFSSLQHNFRRLLERLSGQATFSDFQRDFQDTQNFNHEHTEFQPRIPPNSRTEFQDTRGIPARIPANSGTRIPGQAPNSSKRIPGHAWDSRTGTALGRESHDTHDFRDSNLSKLRKFGSASFGRCHQVPGKFQAQISGQLSGQDKFQQVSAQVSGHARLQPRICAMIPSPRTVEAIARTCQPRNQVICKPVPCT